MYCIKNYEMKICDRDIVKGNYFLDRGGKILRVDEIEFGYDDESKQCYKVGMHNIVDVEPSILYPDGKAHLHPYTEYQSFLKGISLSFNGNSIDGDTIFKGFNEDGVLVINDYYVLSLSYYDGWHFGIDYKESNLPYPIYYEQSFFNVHEVQNIVSSITGYVLELKDEFLLKTVKNGKLF